ncbi:HEAT repeat domain-containing protein [Kitasatospora sp. SUK 42]|uniref:HEAT repeat domain-containing protein n=1 Tax=Kitasatospora sp. SUK 42 TaxID=1588882 RepID=UPI0018CB6400|nr:HEAT repeat domain-containing protein [Kitasatospora sp. SUK 42]MBV2152925.1 HEAT repeat domain-containing protein [Kitasatospora sp. SUK 42]
MSGLADYRVRVARARVAGYIPPTFHTTEVGSDDQAETTQKSYRWLLDQLAECPPRTYLVDGVAGSGKSTLVTHMATDLLAADVACVRVNRETLSQGIDLLGDPEKFGRAMRPAEVDERLWKSRLKHRKCVYLIDAINELEGELGAAEMRFVRLLLDGSHSYPVLATSRTEPDQLGSADLRFVKRLSIAPLTDAEAGGYLRDRGLDPGSSVKEIRAAGMDGAIWNPLLLSLLADLLHTKASDTSTEIPRSRAELLRSTIRRGRKPRHAAPAVDRLRGQGLHLESVLCAATLVVAAGRNDGSFSRNDLRAILDQVWDDQALLDELIEEFLNTQMVAAGPTDLRGDQPYRLLHQSIVDFGLALGWQNTDPPPLAFDLDQCIGDWLGLQEDTDRAVSTLLEHMDHLRPSVLLDVVIANRGRLSEESRRRLWQSLGKFFRSGRRGRDDLARSLGRAPYSVVQEGVEYGLLDELWLKDPQMLPHVLEALRQESLTPEHLQQLRRRKERSDREQGETRAPVSVWAAPSDGLVLTRRRALAEDPDPAKRVRAAFWLARHCPDDAVAPLSTVLATDTQPEVRGAAATAMGHLGNADAGPALRTALESDTVASVRGAAATALGLLGDVSAGPALRTTLESDTGASARGAAATALGRIGDRGAITVLTAAVEADAMSRVRGAAASSLGRLGDAAAAPTLRAIIENPEETFNTRGAAVWALGAVVSDPQLWLIPCAESAHNHNGPDLKSARIFRGAIVNLLARQASNEDVRHWLNRVARNDTDHLNRTAAVRGLSLAHVISNELIRFLIDPDKPRDDGRRRDTDNGVLGVTGAAVIEMFGYDPVRANRLVPSVVELLTDPVTWSHTVSAVLYPLPTLPLDVSQRIIGQLEEAAESRPDSNQYLQPRLAVHRKINQRRQDVAADMRRLRERPEEIMRGFRSAAQPAARPEAERPGASSPEPEYDVAVITAVSVEWTALRRQLRTQEIQETTIQRNGRYYSAFTLEGSQGPVRVIAAQSTDKGGQSAAALTRDMMADFGCTLVLLVGVAGGFAQRGVELYDVLVGKTVHNYDPERIQAGGGGERPQSYKADAQLIRLVQHLHAGAEFETALEGRALHVKDYASGEKVIAWEDAPLRQTLLSMSTDVYGMETEAHGAMHAVWETNKPAAPVGAGIIKCISDLGDEAMREDKESKQQHAATIASRIALQVLAEFHRP